MDAMVELDGVFPKNDPLSRVTAADVGPEIAAELGLPDSPPNVAQKSKQAVEKHGFDLIPLGELMARPDAPVNYLWEGRLTLGSVSLVVAKPKVGKSTLARNLALAVSTGDDFLGWKTHRGSVIYLALEERDDDIKADFRAMGATGQEPIDIHTDGTPQDAMRELVKVVRARKPRLVVIDPLFRFARVRDEKAYAETYQALGPLIDLARETGTHILMVHHAGKSVKADAIDAPLGSTALSGAVSTVMHLKRTDCHRTLQTVQRIGEDLPETILSFDLETHQLFLGGNKADAERVEVETRILEYLKDAGEAKEQAEIRTRVEGATKAIWAALTALVAQGKVTKTGEGKRGKPFLFSRSDHIYKTREQETDNTSENRLVTGEKVVLENQQIQSPVQGKKPGALAVHEEGDQWL
jgi:hypothetical protein